MVGGSCRSVHFAAEAEPAVEKRVATRVIAQQEAMMMRFKAGVILSGEFEWLARSVTSRCGIDDP
jgi:hypothetical protein